jgi:hypothetical protein
MVADVVRLMVGDGGVVGEVGLAGEDARVAWQPIGMGGILRVGVKTSTGKHLSQRWDYG